MLKALCQSAPARLPASPRTPRHIVPTRASVSLSNCPCPECPPPVAFLVSLILPSVPRQSLPSDAFPAPVLCARLVLGAHRSWWSRGAQIPLHPGGGRIAGEEGTRSCGFPAKSSGQPGGSGQEAPTCLTWLEGAGRGRGVSYEGPGAAEAQRPEDGVSGACGLLLAAPREGSETRSKGGSAPGVAVTPDRTVLPPGARLVS